MRSPSARRSLSGRRSGIAGRPTRDGDAIDPRTETTLARLAPAALLLLFLAAISGESFVDPDVYHQLALIREARAIGRIPLEDRFAYTPTVWPSIHHEWGSGVVLSVVTGAGGGTGILLLKYALAVGIAVLGWRAARRGGATVPVLLALLPLGAVLVATGFSTLRAQVHTLFFTALLMAALARDRRGDSRWILPWLAVFVLWVNLHAGFVVGLLLFGLHAAETIVRRRPARGLVLALAAMAVLVLVNPYGWRFVPAIVHGLALDRSLVTEWDPIWRETPTVQALFAFSILAVFYAGFRRDWRELEGLPLVLASALAAIQHQRHLSIHGVVWCALAPAWIAGTPLGAALEGLWRQRRKACAAAIASLGAAAIASLALSGSWKLEVPARPGVDVPLVYPAGAVDYLEEQRFQGNLMTPFTAGAYVSWRLHPRVRVSFDSRYEAAYPPGAALENRDFYAASEGWRATLERYPTDAVLVPAASPVHAEIERVPGWNRAYRDDAFAIFLRPGLGLPAVDRRGETISAAFP